MNLFVSKSHSVAFSSNASIARIIAACDSPVRSKDQCDLLAHELVAQPQLLREQLLHKIIIPPPVGVALGAQLVPLLLCSVNLRLKRVDLLMQCCELLLHSRQQCEGGRRINSCGR